MWRGPLVIRAPTASGKSELAMSVAEILGGEIITSDSMQVYRGLDIGTAKPSDAERGRVPHHLVDVLDISEPLDVYTYTTMAWEKIREVLGRGRLPIVAGGSGLYIRALVYGLDPLPGAAALRARLEEEYSGEEGFARLKALMSERDPEDFGRWHSHQRKLIRALEVFELTGSSITALQKTWPGGPATLGDAGKTAVFIGGGVHRLAIGVEAREFKDDMARVDGRTDLVVLRYPEINGGCVCLFVKQDKGRSGKNQRLGGGQAQAFIIYATVVFNGGARNLPVGWVGHGTGVHIFGKNEIH